MRKPNALLHMTAYGLVYGLLLAMLYIWGFIILMGGSGGEANLESVFWSAYLAFIYGALPGGAMGFVEGILLWFIVRNAPQPMDEFEFRRTRNRAYGIVGALTFLGMGGFLALLFGEIFFLTVLPPIIAAAAALYAVRRYLLKLRAWGSIGKAKNKAKHSDNYSGRLVDTRDRDILTEAQAEAHMRQRKN